MLKKVISGGQTGVDQAALKAARSASIQTGGMAPQGYRTLDGPNYDLKLYGLEESYYPNYPWRTEWNVKHSDATLRIAENFASAGEQCTLKYIHIWRKPYMDVHIKELNLKKVKEVVDWIKNYKIKILNVAGNSEKTCPGIHNKTRLFLRKVFTLDQFQDEEN